MVQNDNDKSMRSVLALYRKNIFFVSDLNVFSLFNRLICARVSFSFLICIVLRNFGSRKILKSYKLWSFLVAGSNLVLLNDIGVGMSHFVRSVSVPWNTIVLVSLDLFNLLLKFFCCKGQVISQWFLAIS